MRIFKNFDELYAYLRDKLPTIEHPVVEEKAEDYDSMTKADLLKIAEEKGIEVSTKATKAEIISAIKGA